MFKPVAQILFKFWIHFFICHLFPGGNPYFYYYIINHLHPQRLGYKVTLKRKPYLRQISNMASSQISFFMKVIGIPLAHNLIRLYLALVRIRVVNEDSLLAHLQSGGKAIAAIWHQRFFGALGYAKKFGYLAPSVIISQSRDGEMIAQVAARLGFRPIRGSSTRGGKEALAAIIEDLAIHSIAIHAVDGPQGPKGIVKPGLIRMAQSTRAAIFPVYISADRVWILNSWDRLLIPKPFSRILIRWGAPIFIPGNMDAETFEAMRFDIQGKMAQGYAQDDRNWGWEKPL